ncbi:hypothetical protein LP420_20895 [Massilia sp. B-10]|nr:hypothetical protein LP420_20895 [Massilia sp. B-10]
MKSILIRLRYAPDVFELAGFDVVLAGAWLLGNDARKMIQAATANRLAAVLADVAQTDRLIRDMRAY